MAKKSKEKNASEKPKKEKIPADIVNIEKKLESIKAHYGKNKQDKRAMREKDRIFSKLRKLKIYHKL